MESFQASTSPQICSRSVLLLSMVCGLNGSLVSHFRAADLQGCFHTMLWFLRTSVAAVQALQRWCITKELPRNPLGHESLLFQSLGTLLEEQSYMPCQLDTIKPSQNLATADLPPGQPTRSPFSTDSKTPDAFPSNRSLPTAWSQTTSLFTCFQWSFFSLDCPQEWLQDTTPKPLYGLTDILSKGPRKEHCQTQ